MNNKTLVTIARLICGTVLMVAHIFTGVDGTVTVVSLFLLGLPIEKTVKEEAEKVL